MSKTVALVMSAVLALATAARSDINPVLKQIGELVVHEANQGVGVDARYFYAVDNQTIAKYDKKSGTLVKR